MFLILCCNIILLILISAKLLGVKDVDVELAYRVAMIDSTLALNLGLVMTLMKVPT